MKVDFCMNVKHMFQCATCVLGKNNVEIECAGFQAGLLSQACTNTIWLQDTGI